MVLVDLDWIVVVVGLGLYMGLWIGVMIVKIFVFILDKVLVGVLSLVVLVGNIVMEG